MRFRYTPDLIKGDLDSLRLDVRHYYEAQAGRIALHWVVIFIILIIGSVYNTRPGSEFNGFDEVCGGTEAERRD